LSQCNVKGQEKWANKGMKRGKQKDVNGLEAQYDKIHSDSSTESDSDPPRKLQKAQYVESWDSKLGKMVYHLMGEGGTVLQLAKDLRDNTYLAHVTGASSAWLSTDHVSPKDKANFYAVIPMLEKPSNSKALFVKACYRVG
jgi:hypothetical protein